MCKLCMLLIKSSSTLHRHTCSEIKYSGTINKEPSEKRDTVITRTVLPSLLKLVGVCTLYGDVGVYTVW